MTDLLTLTGIGQRFSTFQFELLDRQNSHLGFLDIDSASPPSISDNINRNPKRQLNGLRLPPSVTADINTLSERVKPWMVLSDGTRWPLGVFVFADASRELVTSSSPALSPVGDAYWTNGTMLDQLVNLDQATRGFTFFGPGTRINDAIEHQLEAGGVLEYELDPSDASIGDWLVWKPTQTRLKIINDLLGMGGYYSLFYDNNGVAQGRQVPSMDSVDPLFTYAAGENVLDGSVVESDDLLDAPNVYLVVNSGFTEAAIWGEWKVPAAAPHSYENTGRWRVKTIDQQGVESNAAARAAAKAYGQADYSAYRWVDLSTSIDPRLDTFDVVAWKDEKYRQQQRGFPLVADGVMKLELRRVWATSVADELEEDS